MLRSMCWVQTRSGQKCDGFRNRSITSKASEQDPKGLEGVGHGAGRCREHADDIEFVFSFVESEADRGVTVEQSKALP